MDSELLTCLLKFIEYFPDYLSALSRTLFRFVWTTFVETAVYMYSLEQARFSLDKEFGFQRNFGAESVRSRNECLVYQFKLTTVRTFECCRIER